jgi:hypothetical protein
VEMATSGQHPAEDVPALLVQRDYLAVAVQDGRADPELVRPCSARGGKRVITLPRFDRKRAWEPT